MPQPQSASGEWLSISIAPPEGDLEVGVVGYDGVIVALPYPCHRKGADFVDASNMKRADVQPTHWRKWSVVQGV
jgi:hypothetical protein